MITTVKYPVLPAFAVAAMVALAGTASAQSSSRQFEAGAQVVSVRSNAFDATDIGIGGRFAWRPSRALGIEAELSMFPGEFPDRGAFSSGRFEGLFGATLGPQLGRVRPFASVRPGFTRFNAASEPFACIAIFPPPLSCQLGAGRTLLAVELGGGVDIDVAARSFLRINAGDRLIRYPGPVFDRTTVRDDPYFDHDFRVGIGGGIRF